MPRLTKSIIDRTAPQEKDFIVFDPSLPGFGLRVSPKGRKSFLVQYRAKGRTRRLALGRYGTITPDQARRKAQKLLASVADGADPSADRHMDKKAPTVESLSKRFMTEHAEIRCKPTTCKEYQRAFDLFIDPSLGKMKVHHVSRSDVSALHVKHKDIPYQANRTLGVLSVFFTKAEEWGFRPEASSPCRLIKKYPERKRERFLSPRELNRLGDVLRRVEMEGSESPYVVAAFRLLILTGCRLREIQDLKWFYVDFEGRRLRLPDSKTGPKVVSLGQAAIDTLAAIPKVDDNPYVIVGAIEGQNVTDLQKPWRRIRAHIGLDDVRIHDLRHSHASVAVGLGESLPIIGKLLGHKGIQTTERYAHLSADPVRAAADKVSAQIAEYLQASAA